MTLVGGQTATASVPAGSSKGASEAYDLRDGNIESYNGLGVGKAVYNVNNEIANLLTGWDAIDQVGLDLRMLHSDGTERLMRLGGNAILGVSMAVCRSAALGQHLPLYAWLAELSGRSRPKVPMPMVSILSGNERGPSGMDVKDFLIIPVGAETFSEALQWSLRVRNAANECALAFDARASMSENGALVVSFDQTESALQLLMKAIERSSLRPGIDVSIALDIDANLLFASPGKYRFRRLKRLLDPDEMTSMFLDWSKEYPIISIEDPFNEESWDEWTGVTRKMIGIQIVGDTLLSTQPSRINRAIQKGASNAAIVKLNQNGTVSGTLDAISTARKGLFRTIVAGRIGDTEDDFIADLAAGTDAGQIKIGSVRGSERISKYNQLLRIESRDEIEFAAWAIHQQLSP